MSEVVHFPTVEPFLNRVQMAEIMGISTKALDRLVREGLPCRTWGLRTRVFRVSEALAWDAQRQAKRSRNGG